MALTLEQLDIRSVNIITGNSGTGKSLLLNDFKLANDSTVLSCLDEEGVDDILTHMFDLDREDSETLFHCLPTKYDFLEDAQAMHDYLFGNSLTVHGVPNVLYVWATFSAAYLHGYKYVLLDDVVDLVPLDLITEQAKLITRMCNRFNRIAFIVSNRKDVIDTFADRAPLVTTFTCLVKEGEEVAARTFAGEDFARRLKAGNIDLRKSR